MTDLENLWDDYPAGDAPTARILAGAARQRGRRRRLLVRPVLTAGVATGLAGAFVAGTLVDGGLGSGGPGTPPGARPLPSHAAFKADLEPAASCDDLLDTYVRRATDLVGPWGWGGGPVRELANGDTGVRDGFVPLDGVAQSAESADRAEAGNAYKDLRAPRTDRQVNSDTGTNVQEAAVDEPDTVKTDGELLLTVRDDDLVVWDVSGDDTERLSSLPLPGIEDAEIMLSGDTVVAVGADDEAPARHDDPHGHGHGYGNVTGGGATRVLTVSLADPAEPEVTKDVAYDAGLLSARQHGSSIRIVLGSGLPDLAFVTPSGRRSPEQALRRNRELVEGTTIEDWLPSVTSDDKQSQLLDCTNVAIPSDELTIDTTSVVGFDAGAADELDAIGLAGRTGIAYESADHLFLATTSGWDRWDRWGAEVGPGGEPRGTSYLFDFELDGTRATHVASGEVEGSVRDRWSIDEAGGVLRVAVGPSSETGRFNSVVTLERDGQELTERGRLDGLGRNEDIQSVRWFDDLVIMVTFRQVDPLYAVDLTDTTRPRLLGRLKVPGFSSYLHPLGSWRMIGVGEGPSGKGWGAQIGLFDVRDVTKVRRLDVLSYGSRFEALAGLDPRAFTWLPDERAFVTVLQRYSASRVGYVSVVRIGDGQLGQRLMKVEYGDDVDLVRAVPLPDGRVVLVTGEKAAFLEI